MIVTNKHISVMELKLKRYLETNIYFNPSDYPKLRLPEKLFHGISSKQKLYVVTEAINILIEKGIATIAKFNGEPTIKSLIHDDNVYEPGWANRYVR